MKKKKVLLYFMTVIMLLSMTVGVALAEDGSIIPQEYFQDPGWGNGKSSHLYDGLLRAGAVFNWTCWIQLITIYLTMEMTDTGLQMLRP